MNIHKRFMVPQVLDRIKKQEGYVTLISVAILGVIALTIAVSLSNLGINSARSSRHLLSSNKAKAYVNACAESALQIIADNNSYTGTDTIAFTDDDCTYEVIDLGGESRQINITGTVDTGYIRKSKIIINQINPSIIIDSWEEVSDF
jgi:hypothetical protein